MLKVNVFVTLLLLAAFASEDEYGDDGRNQREHATPTVKIEEDVYVKKQWSSQFTGVCWNKNKKKWQVSRTSKVDHKQFFNGYFKVDEEVKAAHASDTLARELMKNGEECYKLNFPEDETEVWSKKKETSSKYFGVIWDKNNKKWQVSRTSKVDGKLYNGYFNLEEEVKAAHASDTLARKLMSDGEEGYKLNFPDFETEVWAEKKETSSKYCGVTWNKNSKKWQVSRRSKIECIQIYNGYFNVGEEIKAAHASDTLARKLMENGEREHKLNFPEDKINIWAEEKETSSKYFGVCWSTSNKKWQVGRWSKIECKTVYDVYFDADEEVKAAHASDALARKLMKNGKERHKLNFSEDFSQVWSKKKRKRKRTDDSNN